MYFDIISNLAFIIPWYRWIPLSWFHRCYSDRTMLKICCKYKNEKINMWILIENSYPFNWQPVSHLWPIANLYEIPHFTAITTFFSFSVHIKFSIEFPKLEICKFCSLTFSNWHDNRATVRLIDSIQLRTFYYRIFQLTDTLTDTPFLTQDTIDIYFCRHFSWPIHFDDFHSEIITVSQFYRNKLLHLTSE